MPIYDYECPNCGLIEDVWANVDSVAIVCPHKCGSVMRRVLSATRSNPDWEPHIDDNLCRMYETEGVLVKSRQHRKELMGQMGLTDKWGEGKKQRWV